MDKIWKDEFNLYFSSKNKFFLKRFAMSTDWKIWQFQKALRKAEYWKVHNTLLYLFYKRKKNKYGLKLGFDIPEGSFESGLRIYHISPVIVNPNAHIGKNAIIVGNLCIGNIAGGGYAPQIGDNCMFGWGCTVIGNITLGNNIKFAAGSLVNKSENKDNITLVGVPAHSIKK